jgi:ATP synthase protein I
MPLRPSKSTADAIRTIGILSSVGIAFVLAVVLGAGLGLLLDRWLGTSPWLFVAFFFVGLAAGILNVFRMAKSSGL